MKPEDIANIEWHAWPRRPRTPFFGYTLYHYATENNFDLDFDYTLKTNGCIVTQMVTKKSDLVELGERIWEKNNSEPEFVLNFMKNTEEKNKAHRIKWRKLLKVNFKEKTNKELVQYYADYARDSKSYTASIYIPLAIENQLFKAGLEIIEKLDDGNAEALLFKPIKPGLAIQEEKSLLEIAVALEKNKEKKNNEKNAREKLEEQLARHVENFGWTKRNGFFMEFYDKEHYLQKAKAIPAPREKLNELNTSIKNDEKQFAALITKLSALDKTLFETINLAIFFRSFRTELRCQSSFYVEGLFGEIAKRVGLVNPVDTAYLLPHEVENALCDKTNTKSLVDERKIAFAYVSSPDGDLNANGEEALRCLQFFQQSQKIENTGEVKGTVNYKGNASGRAVVVKNLSELSKVKPGDILIAQSTTPDFVPALKLIKGLVTEEGGILCHAAVVSREMKIPCIIGAKHAISIFKDGDYVELDTETGRVKKIER